MSKSPKVATSTSTNDANIDTRDFRYQYAIVSSHNPNTCGWYIKTTRTIEEAQKICEEFIADGDDLAVVRSVNNLLNS